MKQAALKRRVSEADPAAAVSVTIPRHTHVSSRKISSQEHSKKARQSHFHLAGAGTGVAIETHGRSRRNPGHPKMLTGQFGPGYKLCFGLQKLLLTGPKATLLPIATTTFILQHLCGSREVLPRGKKIACKPHGSSNQVPVCHPCYHRCPISQQRTDGLR